MWEDDATVLYKNSMWLAFRKSEYEGPLRIKRLRFSACRKILLKLRLY